MIMIMNDFIRYTMSRPFATPCKVLNVQIQCLFFKLLFFYLASSQKIQNEGHEKRRFAENYAIKYE